MSDAGQETRDGRGDSAGRPAVREGDPDAIGRDPADRADLQIDVADLPTAVADLRAELTDLRADVDHLLRLVGEREAALSALDEELRRCRATLAWRLHVRSGAFQGRIARVPLLGAVYGGLRRAVEIGVDHGVVSIFSRSSHKVWRTLRRQPSQAAGDETVAAAPGPRVFDDTGLPGVTGDAIATVGTPRQRGARTPLVSVLAVLPDRDPAVLQRLRATLQDQTYPHWELCVALSPSLAADDLMDTHGPEPVRHQPLRLVESVGQRPSYADAARAARGEIVAVLGAGDELSPETLAEVAACFAADDETDVVYTDEDAITAQGQRAYPFLKPGWSPDLLLSMCYLDGLLAVRRRVLEESGGFGPIPGPGQIYDLALRIADRPRRIVHIPRVLYHRRLPPACVATVLQGHAAERAERDAIARALQREGQTGAPGALFTLRAPRAYSTRLALQDTPLVSIVIPTRDNPHLLRTALDTIRARTAYREYEIIVVDNGSTDPEALRYLEALEAPCRVYRWPHEFNYAAINNVGVEQARGTQLLFLNNDVEIVQADWLTALVEHAQRPAVGAVGAKLLYPDGRIQHAGVVLGVHGLAVHAFRGWPGRVPDHVRLADVVRNCSALTGACLMVPRRVFDQVGGFDAAFRIAFNDIDLCLRIRQHGYRVVYTPHAVLTHFESATRGDGEHYPPSDRSHFEERWGTLVAHTDPYHHPLLAGRPEDWSFPRIADEGPAAWEPSGTRLVLHG